MSDIHGHGASPDSWRPTVPLSVLNNPKCDRAAVLNGVLAFREQCEDALKDRESEIRSDAAFGSYRDQDEDAVYLAGLNQNLAAIREFAAQLDDLEFSARDGSTSPDTRYQDGGVGIEGCTMAPFSPWPARLRGERLPGPAAVRGMRMSGPVAYGAASHRVLG